MTGGHLPVPHLHRHGVQVDRQPEQLLGAEHEVPGEPLGVEGDHVVAEQPGEQLLAPGRWQHPPRVRAGPWDVQEERQHHLGAALPHPLADQVEVVVVQHHQGAPAAGLDLLDHRVGEELVDGLVAMLVGVVLAPGQLRVEREPVHAVLQEPQQRVGDHRVEVVVRLLVDLHHSQPHGGGSPVTEVVLGLVEQPRPGLEGHLEGPMAVLAGHRDVLLGAGRTHPDGVGQVGDQTGERRDQPACAAAGGAAGIVPTERDRPAVRQQDHRQVRCVRSPHVPRSSRRWLPPAARLGSATVLVGVAAVTCH